MVAVNNSWGGNNYSTIYDDLIDMLGEDGVVSVIAAGNDGANTDNIMYNPANSESDYAVTVGAANIKGEAELQLSVVQGEHFISDNPYRLKVTLKNANPGENYYVYFPYEKNPLTTGDDNTYFSFFLEQIPGESTTGAIIHGGEVSKSDNGRLILTDAFGYGNGLDITITGKSNEGVLRHAVNVGAEGTKYLLSADEAEGKQVGLGICIKGDWMDETTNDISFYLDSIAVSKPNAAINPNTSYEVMTGTSMACPSAAGVCALVASLNPRQDGESGSDYAKRIRTALFSIVRQNEKFEEKCSTGGYLDLSLLNTGIPAVTDAVCDVERETITPLP